MKKTLSIFIATLMIVSLLMASCGAADKLTGKWAVTAGGIESFAMEFTKDGKMTVSTMGVTTVEADYKVKDNTITYSVGGVESKIEFTIKNDTLNLDFGGISYSLNKVD